MFKGLISEVANEVGVSGAILLNQLHQWFKSKNREKIYRTNVELTEDLCGLLSTATIQRAKVKLIEKGYVTVSFDKGDKRTTHYSLTEKAKLVLGMIKQTTDCATKIVGGVKAGVDVIAESAKKVTTFNKPQAPKQAPVITDTPTTNKPKDMKESFEEQGKRKSPMPIPQHLLEALKGKVKKVEVVEEPKPEALYSEDNSDELFTTTPKFKADIVSEEDYFESIESVLNLAFNGIPNVAARNENLKNKELDSNFNGWDY